jgi:DNA-binding PadR family transcriptional regulator
MKLKMKELLFSNYTELNKENSEWIVLNLLHELRIMTANQLEKLINLEFSYSQSSVYRTLSKLVSLELVDYITLENDSKLKYFYLTKFGHNSIGGLYSFPKRPEYNLNHHIQVTNYLIDSLALAKKKIHLFWQKVNVGKCMKKKTTKKISEGPFITLQITFYISKINIIQGATGILRLN